MEERVRQILSSMTIQEKAALLCGSGFWYAGNEKTGKIMLTDGPSGLRKQQGKADMSGINESVPATVYPCACLSACSWDESLLFRMGEMLGRECRKEDVSVLLGPAVNHKRDPRGGRNFEYFSEDPLLSGKLGAAYVRGVQSAGVGACVKHFACNSQEDHRMFSDSVVDERALREIYLKQFEIIVKEAKPWALMTAYNKLNGVPCSQNARLMEIAREEWGFDGVFLTDWGALYERADAYAAGLDLEMPGVCGGAEETVNAVAENKMSESTLDARAEKVLGLILKSRQQGKKSTFDRKESLFLAQEIAEESAVLLKNEDDILPLTADGGEKIAIIGAFAEKPRYQGGGSGKAVPSDQDSFLRALKECGAAYDYARGYDRANGESSGRLIAEAAALAGVRRCAVVFAGFAEGAESEGYDKQGISLPASQNKLIEAVAEANPNTVVVLSCGCPITMPWLGKVKGVLLMYLAGCQSGKACASLLFGAKNPSGKLAETFPLRIEDVPAYSDFGRNEDYAEYLESIFTGYRWYDAAEKKVLFPFGFGLSYTKFEYGPLVLSSENLGGNGSITARIRIKNTGTRAGAEVVQIYVGQKSPVTFKPEKELRAFKKIRLAAGEEQEIEFTLNRDAFSHYDPEKGTVVERGNYFVMAAASSRDIRAKACVRVDGDEGRNFRECAPAYYGLSDEAAIPREQFYAMSGLKHPEPRSVLPITLHSPLKDMANSKGGKLLYRLMRYFAGKGKDPDTAKMQRVVLAEMPVIGLTVGIPISREGAQGFAEIANGHRLRGIKIVLRDLKKYRKKRGKSPV